MNFNEKVATRQSFGEALEKLGKENKNIVVLDADLSGATKTNIFAKSFPNRFFNMGIAEQNMIATAVKAKMKLDAREVSSLMDRLLQLPNPFTCPHGRPTAIKMTKIDFEKKFNRR